MGWGGWWWDAGSSTWRDPINLYAYESGSTWREAKDAWLIDSGNVWRLAHTTASLSGFGGTDVGASPADGDISFYWTHTGDPDVHTAQIHADLTGGTSYTTLIATVTGSSDAQVSDLSGTPGFTSLDDTTFRLRLTAGGGEVISENTISPPYPV